MLMSWLMPVSARAQSADLKIKDVSTNENTAIFIEKNAERGQTRLPRDYEVITGEEEVIGDPSNIDDQARKNWKQACAEWQGQMKELNKGNILALSCGRPIKTKDSFNISFESKGSYKLRVRIRDEQPAKRK